MHYPPISKNYLDNEFERKIIYLLKEYNVNNLIVAGGVSANKGLRESLTEACEKENIKVSFPKLSYCTDNAAMIGITGYLKYKKEMFDDVSVVSKARFEL